MAVRGGYNQDRFTLSVPRGLVCCVCHEVLREPRLCQDGEHRFCLSCISRCLNETKQCPMCKKHLTEESLVHPQSYLRQSLGELQIKCDHVQRGCPNQIQLGNLEDHVSHCGFAPVTCEKCGMQINSKDKDNHEKSFCQLGAIKCEECVNIKTNQDEIRKSQTEIRKSQTEMRKSQTEMRKSQTEMRKSQTEMMKSQTEMKKSQTGMKKSQTGMRKSQTEMKKSQTGMRKSQTEMRNTQTGMMDILKTVVKNQSTSTTLQGQFAHSLDELKRKHDQMGLKQDEMTSEMSEVNRKLSRIENNLEGNTNDARVMKEQFELFIKKFDRVADRLSSNVSSSNEEIIIMGGCGQDSATYNSVSIFNPASGKYTELPPMNIARSGASSCVYNHEVIIAGGSDEKTGLDTIEILKINQVHLPWTISSGKLPCRLSGYALKVYQEKLLAIGGYNWDTKTVSNEIHELALDEPHTATLLATMPEPRRRHTAEIVNGQLFILGGTTTHNENEKENVLDSVIMYDFITKKFETCEPLPKPVCHMSTVTRGNKIIVVGGENKKKQDLNDVIMYDTETGRSEILPSLNHERRHHSAVICDGVIFAFGGFSKKKALNSVESWKIDSDENWTERRGMSKKRACVTAVVKPKW